MNNLEISAVDKSAIDHTFASQKAYALKLRKSTCAERLEVLARFEKVFKASYAKMYAAAAADFGKPEAEVDMGEIMVVVSELAHIRKQLKKWMKATPVQRVYGDARHLVKNYCRAEGHKSGDLALELSV